MDGEMREKITMGMMVVCLVLALVAMFSTSWLVSEGDESEGEPDATSSLTTMYMELGSSEECDGTVAVYDAMGMEAECDGKELSIAWSEVCDEMDDDDACDTASAGMTATICMWLGIGMALVCVLMAVLPMAGVDAMDNLPEMAGMIASWAAGGMMILGLILWKIMLPDGDASMGMATYMAIIAGVMGLASTAMNTFMADE